MTPHSRIVSIDAIRKEQFYILTHPDWMEVIELRTGQLLRMENPQNPTPALVRIVNRPR